MLVGFKSRNHPQQVAERGHREDIDDRALLPDDFAPLMQRFRFTVDAAASDENHKVPRYYTRARSGLDASWEGERVYCNPPFSSIGPWAAKAWEESGAHLIVMLLPANRCEQRWWQEFIEPRRDRVGSPLRVEFQRGRWRFLQPGQTERKPNERPPFGCCLCIWNWEQFNTTELDFA
jgi:phage N-6-adenine-methyltransferase